MKISVALPVYNGANDLKEATDSRLHQQAYSKELGHLKLPLTEAIHREVVSLPISPVLTDEQVAAVISSVDAYHA